MYTIHDRSSLEMKWYCNDANVLDPGFLVINFTRPSEVEIRYQIKLYTSLNETSESALVQKDRNVRWPRREEVDFTSC